ncbi:MAG TPA: HEAT repeat domain-containing protein [Rhizomicrobium sp.]|nr:HEAT repeat domain-containing protein [Rhizomicrobium sp.]
MKFAARLEQFGQPAKLELLKRAAGDDRGWRNLSGAILMYWHSFDTTDVSALIEALKKEPGGWIARPLGHIGTPEAIEALADDVRQHGAENQSGWALSQIGDRVFPYLLPLLSDDKQWYSAATIMRDMKLGAKDGLTDWLAIALDSKKSDQDRIGALRGIGILGTSAREVAPNLRPLLSLNDGYGLIPETAKLVLAAMGDQSVATDTILTCEPSTDPFEGSFDSTVCLERAAVFGMVVMPYANSILSKFTSSRTGADRANGASILGFIGYAPAKQRLIELLNDTDWRVVYAATRSLGWLKAREAVPALTRIAHYYWLPDVRNEAVKVISALRSASDVLPRPESRSGTLGQQPSVALEVDATLAPDIAPCESSRWNWHGIEFREPDDVAMTLKIDPRGDLPGGRLVGRDSGEWGGEVKWETGSQEPSFVAYGNVEGIQPAVDGAIAVIGSGGVWTSYDEKRPTHPDGQVETITISNGPGGSGYALALRRDSSGAWRVNEVARFPRAAFGLKTIGRDLYAVWSGNRAIVFKPTGIEGLAQCVTANGAR